MRVSNHKYGPTPGVKPREKWPDGATHEYRNPVGGRLRFVRLIRRGESYSIVSMWMEDKKRWKSQTDTVENSALKIIGL